MFKNSSFSENMETENVTDFDGSEKNDVYNSDDSNSLTVLHSLINSSKETPIKEEILSDTEQTQHGFPRMSKNFCYDFENVNSYGSEKNDVNNSDDSNSVTVLHSVINSSKETPIKEEILSDSEQTQYSFPKMSNNFYDYFEKYYGTKENGKSKSDTSTSKTSSATHRSWMDKDAHIKYGSLPDSSVYYKKTTDISKADLKVDKTIFKDGNVRLLKFKLTDRCLSTGNIYYRKLFYTKTKNINFKWEINNSQLVLRNYHAGIVNDVNVKIKLKLEPSCVYSKTQTMLFKNISDEKIPIIWKFQRPYYKLGFTFKIVIRIYLKHESHLLVSNKLSKLFNNPSHSDVTFIVGDIKFHAHKAVLEEESGKFKELFAGPEKVEIKIDNVEPEIFKLFLQFFYTGKIPTISDEQWLPLTFLTHDYGLNNHLLVSTCAINLVRNLSVKNALGAYILFDIMGKNEYKYDAKNFMNSKKNEMGQVKIESFFKSSSSSLCKITQKLLEIQLQKFTLFEFFTYCNNRDS